MTKFFADESSCYTVVWERSIVGLLHCNDCNSVTVIETFVIPFGCLFFNVFLETLLFIDLFVLCAKFTVPKEKNAISSIGLAHQLISSSLQLSIFCFKGHSSALLYGAAKFFGQRSSTIISGSSCGNCMLWDKDTEELVHALPCNDQSVHAVAVHPRCPIVTTTAQDNCTAIWSPRSPRPVVPGQVSHAADRNRAVFTREEMRDTSYRTELGVLRRMLKRPPSGPCLARVQYL